MKRRKHYIILLFLISSLQLVEAQSSLEGLVSFITSDNVYVRFQSTDAIKISDTLYFNEVACLEVIKKSSTSCICQNIGECPVQKDDVVTLKEIKINEIEEAITTLDTSSIPLSSEVAENNPDQQLVEEPNQTLYKQKINVRSSVATYSSFSPFENNDRHRLVGRMSMNIDNISNSKLSLNSNFNYRRNLQPNAEAPSPTDRLFRVYNLALSYEVDSTIQLSVGRKINRNLSSIGAIDGIQVEKQFSNFITGAVIGFRPDFFDYGFNLNLFEYGTFIGHQLSSQSIYSRTTLGFLEQRNAWNIDRRYMHFQSIQTINRNLHLFGSMEVDLYSRLDNETSFQPRLTNLYLSTRYHFNRRLSLTLSYDNRKRIIFYETFRTQVEDLLNDDIARQGLRLRVSLRPINGVFAGVSLAKRFQSDSENKSDNLNAFVTLNRFLIKGGTLSFRFNRNLSNYLKSNIYSTTFSFYSFKNKLNTQLYYRNVQYDYFTSESKSTQNYYGANFYLRITRSLRFGLLVEVSDRQDNRYYRMNTKLIKRLNKK